MTDIIDIVVSFSATFFGVLLALWFDRRKTRSEERQLKRRVLKALQTELEAILVEVEQGLQVEEKVAMAKEEQPRPMVLTLLPISAYESAKNAGYLSLFSPELQYRLSDLYRVVASIEIMLKNALAAYRSLSVPADNVRSFMNVASFSLGQLLDGIPPVLQLVIKEEHELSRS